MKQLRNLAVVLILVSLASFSPLMAQFEVPLTVTDGANSYTLYFGIVPGTDICINAADVFNGHPEGFLPPPPPGGVFDARFISPRTAQAAVCYDQGSSNDFRPFSAFTQKDTFRVKSQLGTGTTMTLSWPNDLATRFTALNFRFFDGSGNVNVDMLTNTSVDVTAAGDPATINIFSAGLVPPPPGTLVVAPGLVNFGSIQQFGTAVDSVVASNPGTNPVNITAVGSNNAVFSVLPAAPQNIPPGGNMTFYITFAPTAVGPQNGVITFTNDGSTGNQTVNVSGSATAAPPPPFEVNLSVTDGGATDATYNLYFGFVPGADICINVLDGFNGHFEGPLPPPPPGGVFDSRFISPRTINAAICYDQGSSNDFRNLVAEGQLDTFRVKSQLGTGTTMTISWPAGLNLKFDYLTLRYFDGSGNVNVDMLTTLSADVTLAGDPATVNIFSKLKTSGPPPPPSFGVAPTSIPFGNVVVASSATDSVTVSNTGGDPLNITAVSSSNPRFTVLPAAPQSIAGGGSMKFYITFAPIAAGAQSGNISFTHNAAGSPGLVGVSGTGIVAPPCFTATPNPLNFGGVQLDSVRTLNVLISNGDAAPMVITAVNSSDPAFVVAPQSVTIPPSGSQSFTVTAGPISVAGPHSGTLSFVFTGPSCSPGIVNVSATFYQAGNAWTSLVPDSIANWVGNYYQRPTPRIRNRPMFPNWANMLLEVMFQGGFRPTATESDLLGGMRLGLSRLDQRGVTGYYYPRSMREDTAWVRLGRWVARPLPAISFGYGSTQLQVSLLNYLRSTSTFYRHDQYSRGLDSTYNPGDLHRRPLRGQQNAIYPRFSKNQLFGELVAMKFNIAASQLGKTPSGFGELRLNVAGNPCDGLSIVQISAKIDSALTLWKGRPQAEFDSLYSAAYWINRAFVGPLDTTNNGLDLNGSFYVNKNLVVNGVRGLAGIPYLQPGLTPPMTMMPMNLGLEAYELPDPEFNNPEPVETIPSAIKLYQNYPNPFNPTTNISFHLAQPAQVTLKIYNVLGQEIATLMQNEEMGDGLQSVNFDASSLSSGVYFYIVTGQELESGAAMPQSMGKMMLMK